MSKLLEQTFMSGLDRFKKLRIGQLTTDIDDKGQVTVNWLDGEPGGQSNIQISYPGLNNSSEIPNGIEIGHGRGTVGVFGFIADNHAVLLVTIISKVSGKQVGYDKTDEIKSGEVRIISKTGSKIFLDQNGNIDVNCTNQILINMANGLSVSLSNTGKVDITTKDEINITCKKLNLKTDTTTTSF